MNLLAASADYRRRDPSPGAAAGFSSRTGGACLTGLFTPEMLLPAAPSNHSFRRRGVDFHVDLSGRLFGLPNRLVTILSQEVCPQTDHENDR